MTARLGSLRPALVPRPVAAGRTRAGQAARHRPQPRHHRPVTEEHTQPCRPGRTTPSNSRPRSRTRRTTRGPAWPPPVPGGAAPETGVVSCMARGRTSAATVHTPWRTTGPFGLIGRFPRISDARAPWTLWGLPASGSWSASPVGGRLLAATLATVIGILAASSPCAARPSAPSFTTTFRLCRCSARSSTSTPSCPRPRRPATTPRTRPCTASPTAVPSRSPRPVLGPLQACARAGRTDRPPAFAHAPSTVPLPAGRDAARPYPCPRTRRAHPPSVPPDRPAPPAASRLSPSPSSRLLSGNRVRGWAPAPGAWSPWTCMTPATTRFRPSGGGRPAPGDEDL